MFGVGVIGLGIMGRRMAEGFEKDPRFRLISCFDRHPSTEASKLPLADSAQAVIAHPNVHCVYIATPPSTHLALTQAAAKAGKTVFCEKPLAASVEEAIACMHAVEQSDVLAAVNFIFARSPAALQLQQLINEHALGDIRSAQLTLRFARWPRGWQAGAKSWLALPAEGGFTREVASHFLFLTSRLFGPGKLRTWNIERDCPPGTETKVNAVIDFGKIALTIDAAVEGEQDDFNRFEVMGSKNSAAIVNWSQLEYKSELSQKALSLNHQLDGLHALMSGRTDHKLATFREAAAVVALVEELLATPALQNAN